jgi:hypothetical protein
MGERSALGTSLPDIKEEVNPYLDDAYLKQTITNETTIDSDQMRLNSIASIKFLKDDASFKEFFDQVRKGFRRHQKNPNEIE